MGRNIEYQRGQRQKAREYVQGYLDTHPCTMCGLTDTRVLQFHHRNPADKHFTISSMVSRGMKVADIRKEVQKTTILCSNCHIIHHHEERQDKQRIKSARKSRQVLAR